MVAHQETANTKGKNASDIGLVIDAMDILHTGRFDGFVIVSSDSDFTALANRIREQGLEVIGIGEDKTPESLRNVCNRFVYIHNIINETKGEKESSQSKKSPVKKAIPIITAAIEKLDQDDECYSLSALGKQIMTMHSDFDTRTYGRKKLSELVRSLDGHFEIIKKNNAYFVSQK